MAAQSILLTFEGYWTDHTAMPAKSGIYLVYACTHSAQLKRVSLRKLIYIGESTDVQDRLATHEKWPDWKRQLHAGETLAFAFANVINPDRERAEAALINYHKPPVNTQYTDSFPWDATTVTSSGDCALITSPITVNKTQPKAASLRY